MSYQSDATYSDGSVVSPTDSEKHILGQIAKNTQGAAVGSGTGATAANQQKQLTGLPYGAVRQDITYGVAGPTQILYKDSTGATLVTRAFLYENGGVNTTDRVTRITDT